MGSMRSGIFTWGGETVKPPRLRNSNWGGILREKTTLVAGIFHEKVTNVLLHRQSRIIFYINFYS